MKQKLFTFFLALVASVSAIYAQSGTCGYNLTWRLSNGTLTISGTGAMADYEFYNSPWNDYRSSIQSVIISDGVTSIGNVAFYDCSSLTSVTIPNSVTSIGDGAFQSCSSLTSITIPNSVKSIGNYTFDGCSSLTFVHTTDLAAWCKISFGSADANPLYYAHNLYLNGNLVKDLVIPNSVTSIGDYAFSVCTSLTSVTIPNSVTSIGIGAFYKCISLTSITIPNSVTSIGSEVFYNCSKLTSVNIPNSVTSIGEWAFKYCSSLTSITIPNSVTSIGESAFMGCSKLTSVTINSDAIVNKAYTYSSNLSDIFGSQVTKYIIGDNVKGIGNYAFDSCSSLASVTIPNSVTSIGKYAFYGCSSLTSVTIPNSVTSIGSSAFSGCSSVTFVTIPNRVTSIENYTFSGCSSLTSVTIGDGVTSIGDYTFKGCSSLTSVTIPNSVTSIGNSAFYACSSLTSVTINSDAIVNKAYTYSSNLSDIFGSQVTKYIIGDNVKGIGSYAFYECSSLTSVTIGNSVTSIGKYAFSGCSSLTSVTIPNSVTSIGGDAFYACSKLTSVTIPNSVTSIGGDAFYACSKLTSVTVEAETPPITGMYVFYYNNYNSPDRYQLDVTIYVPCGTIEAYKSAWSEYASRIAYSPINIETKVNNEVAGEVVAPENMCDEMIVTAIPNRGYKFTKWSDGNTDNPRSLVLQEELSFTAIFDYALSGKCGKDSALTWTLDTTTMALNITGKGALSENYTYGTFIESLTIGNEITSIGEWAFGECNNLKTVIIGSSVKVLEAAAFAYCSSIDTITCYSQRPPTVKQDALYGIKYSTIVYVPASYLNYYVMHDAWGLYDVRPMGIALTLSANNAAYGTLVGAGTYAQNATVTFSAKPNNGYHFARWSDGNTENPRTIILTQDTTFTAVFEASKSGVCGHNNALQWTYDGQSRTLTITGRAALDENYTFGVEALTQMRTLIIGNNVTAIGDSAFYGVSSIYHLEIGANVASIGNYTFAECRRLEDITCYAEDVPVINATTFDNVGNKQYIYLYVPDGRERAYKRDEFWGEFDVQVKGAETVSDPVDDVIVNPSDNTADITWPVVNNAGTYEITITKDDVVVCTLIFNANGQLAGIAFAPGKEGRAHYAQAATLTANGFRFTITGLTSATKYGYSVVSKNTSNAVVDTKSGTFTTTGSQQVPTNLDQIGSSQDGTKGRLVLHNGQVLILRNGKTYTMQGQEVK